MFSWLRRQRPPGPAAPAAYHPPPASAESPAVLLGEVAGALLTQLTLAQARADEAAQRCGEGYRQHPWLARFPVPSLAIDRVEVDLRVAVVQAGPADGALAPYDASGEMDPGESTMYVLFTAAQLQAVPPELISTVRLTLRTEPKRLVEVDGRTLLLP